MRKIDPIEENAGGGSETASAGRKGRTSLRGEGEGAAAGGCRRGKSKRGAEYRHPRAHFRFGAVERDEKRCGDYEGMGVSGGRGEGALTREILIPC